MLKVLFYVFIFLFFFCVFLKVGLNKISEFNEEFFERYFKFCDLLGILAWIFVIFAFIMFVIDKIQGVII